MMANVAILEFEAGEDIAIGSAVSVAGDIKLYLRDPAKDLDIVGFALRHIEKGEIIKVNPIGQTNDIISRGRMARNLNEHFAYLKRDS